MKISINLKPMRYEMFSKGDIEYLEIGATEWMEMDKSEFQQRASYIEKNDIKVICANRFIPGEYDICKAGYDRQKCREYVKGVADILKYFDCKKVVLGSGKARFLDESYGIEKGKAQFFDFMKTVCEVMAKDGVKVVIEPLNKGETNFINSVKEGYDIVKESGIENAGVLCDYFHAGLDNEPLSDVVEAKSKLWHAHIASFPGRLAPLPNDGTDYAPFFDALKKAGYDDFVSVESKWSSVESMLNTFEFLRTFC